MLRMYEHRKISGGMVYKGSSNENLGFKNHTRYAMKKKQKEKSKFPIIHNCEQGSPEWIACRRGLFTASTFGDLFLASATRGYQNLINAVVFERITGETPESFESDYMKRGKELEAEALESYESLTFNKVTRVGFVQWSEWAGASPDGLIGKEGVLEIKSPKYSTLIDYHLNGKVPSNYGYQMQGEMMCSGRTWTDFYVYHPNFPPILKRVPRDETIIAQIHQKLIEAIQITINRIEQIERKKQ